MKKHVGIAALLVGFGVPRAAVAADLTLNLGSDPDKRAKVSVELVGAQADFANSLSVVVVSSPNQPFATPIGLGIPGLGGSAIPLNGCNPASSVDLPPIFLLSEKKAQLLATPPDLTPTQRGCRVELQFLPARGPPVDTFPNGAVLRFTMCAQTNSTPTCEYLWSSDPEVNRAAPTQYTTGNETGQLVRVSFTSGDPCFYPPGQQPGCQQEAGEHVITRDVIPNKVWRMEWEDLPYGSDGFWADFNDIIVNVRAETDDDGDGVYADLDRDGDGLYDSWETAGGIDIDANGTIDLPLPDAHLTEKDVYIHFDYMDCAATNTSPTVAGVTYDFGNVFCSGNPHSHRPSANVLGALQTAFLNAPGGRIHLHVDPDMTPVPHTQWMTIRFGDGGCGLPSCPTTGTAPCTVCTDSNTDASLASPCVRSFDEYKKAYFGNNNPKRFAYHYALIGHRMTKAKQNTGCGEMAGNDFFVSIGGALIDNVGTDQELAGTIMHELGHNLFLGHGGDPSGPEAIYEYKPNYPSVMSYTFQSFGLVGQAGTNSIPWKIDYSAGLLASITETSLLETANPWPSQPGKTRWYLNGGTAVTNFGQYDLFAGGHDWNQNGGATPTMPPALETTMYAYSLDRNAQADRTFSDHNDWAALRFNFHNTGDYEDGVHENSVPGGEPSFAETHPPVSDAGFVADGDPNSLGDLYACYLGQVESLDGSGSYDVAGGTIEDYSWSFDTPTSVGASGAIAAYSCTTRMGAAPIWLVVTDNDANSTIDDASCQVTLDGGADQTLECTSPAGANATLGSSPLLPGAGFAYAWTDNGASAGSTPQVTRLFSIGTHAVTVVATDVAAPIGDVSQSDSLTITIQDTTAPTIESVEPSDAELSILWPGNHKMNTISFNVAVTDTCDSAPACQITDISSNEPLLGTGDGDTSPDWEILGPLIANIRAERSASGTGRIYTITVKCTDDYGNESTRDGYVTVPLNQG